MPGAKCYANGDYDEAVRLFKEALKNYEWNADAQRWLGLCYMDGRGVKADWGQAESWIARSVAGNEAYGLFALNLLYFKSGGVKLALDYLKQAAAKGYPFKPGELERHVSDYEALLKSR